MSFHNRLRNSRNGNQGSTKTVLCVCSAGLLRSPTSAHILSASPFNFNTRAAGSNSEYALILVDKVLLNWADIVICMQEENAWVVNNMLEEMTGQYVPEVITLDCPDNFGYRDPKLVKILTDKFIDIFL